MGNVKQKELKSIITGSLLTVTLIAVSCIMLFTLLMQVLAAQNSARKLMGERFVQLRRILEENDNDLADVENTIRQDFLTSAETAAFILTHHSDLMADTGYIREIAGLLGVDEIWVFDSEGRIFAGTDPAHFGMTFDSGEQMAYFKPMLEDKTLTLTQEIIPRTADGDPFQYTAIWNPTGDFIVQIGRNARSALMLMEKYDLSYIFAILGVNGEYDWYSVDESTGRITGSTFEEDVGRTLAEIGLDTGRMPDYANGKHSIVHGEISYCMFREEGDSLMGCIVPSRELYRDVIPSAVMTATMLIFSAIVMTLTITRKMDGLIVRDIHAANKRLRAIAAGALDERVELSGSLEFAELGNHINGMVAALREKVEFRERIFSIVAQHSNRVLYYYDHAEGTARPWDTGSAENDTFAGLFSAGMRGDEIDAVLPDSLETAEAAFARIRGGEPFGQERIHIRLNDGAQGWYHIKYSNIYDGSRPVTALISVKDITEQHEHEMSHLRFVRTIEGGEAEHLGYLEANLTVDTVDKHTGTFLIASRSHEGGSYTDYWREGCRRSVNGELKDAVALYSRENLIAQYRQGITRMNNIWRLDAGDVRWVKVTADLLEDSINRHIKFFASMTDVTRECEERMAVNIRADYDAMTGLLRRDAGEAMIRQAMLDGDTPPGILIALDLDDLKGINDTMGHTVGDQAIAGIADALKGHFRKTDILVRAGGDEFFAYLPGSAESAGAVALSIGNLLRKLSGITVGAGGEYSIHCSIGCALEQQGDSFKSLFERADTALYHVKRSGKNSYAFFEPEMLSSNYEFRSKKLLSAPGNQKSSQDELHRLLNALASFYQMVLSVNLSANSYYLMEEVQDGLVAGLPASGALSDLVQLLSEPVHPDDREAYFENLSRDSLLCAFSQGRRSVCHRFRILNSGEYRWMEYVAIFYTNDRGDISCFTLLRWMDERAEELERMYCELSRDISAGRAELCSIKGRLAMEDILFRCVSTLTRETDTDRAINQFLQLVGSYYRANRAYIIEFDLEAGLCSNTFEWCAPGVSAELENLQDIPLSVIDDWIRKFRTEGEFSISSIGEDLDPDAEDFRILEAQGIVSLLAAPLCRDDEIVGFLGLDDAQINIHALELLKAVSGFVLEELEKHYLMSELDRVSRTDELTRLRNRNHYANVLKGFESGSPGSLGIVSLDVNGLRDINDTYGHEYGDRVLQHVASLLARSCPYDLYRVGGDEFVALCVNAGREEFEDCVMKLRAACEADKTCDVAIGIAWGEEDTINVTELLQRAEEMRYAEKRAYYHTVLSEGHSISRVGYAGEVLEDIANDRFVVHYQPQVRLSTGEVVGAEALVRKKAEDGSLIFPGRFIPFYEVGGVISHVDLYVLRTACTALAGWLAQGRSLRVSVNFSRMTLMEPFIVETISGICAECGVPGEYVTIEVTESIAKMESGQLKELTARFRAAGFRIALDDFGSKYSNLAILADMDFDEIKFDRSLVSTLEGNEKSRVVMESTLSLCRALNATTSLAEGIETRGQLRLLAGLRCDHGQGYYFSKPIPLEDFERYLETCGRP